MSLLAQFSDELESLVARTAPSVVGVEHRRGQGTGVILTRDGYVVTNAHVVRGGRALKVQVPGGERVRADLVGADDRTDLAIVRIDAGTLPPLELAEAVRVRVGQVVLAIGNPLRFDRSVSLGVVSALDRSLQGPAGPFEGLIQTDAAINPGNSGGPLVDVQGRVVGINTAMIPYAQGIGFAVPAQTVNWVAAVLMHRGSIQRPYLGVAARGEPLTPALVAETGQERAVKILGVTANTPADAAGLREGDLLLRANESALASIDDLQRVMVLSSGPAVRLEVLRAGARHALTARPELQHQAA